MTVSDLIVAAALGRLLLRVLRALPALRHQVASSDIEQGQANEAEERVSLDTNHSASYSRSAECDRGDAKNALLQAQLASPSS